ncbi:MAG: DUF1003 domain-containing protein [Chloroflexi bacterium]|nr:DUF1003 domain-containing protein [Chloroflexota bacterium]
MARKQPETVTCQICGKQKKMSEAMPAELVREPLVEIIRRTHPDWSSSGFICLSDLDQVRTDYVKNVLETEKGELSTLEEDVIKSLKEQELLSENINVEFDQKLTFGQRLSDKLADSAGSWGFIIAFGVVILLWIIINTVLLVFRHFDPYPFILLNLVLSCLAALQAPVILMSQNRQESRDRLRAEYDYRVNLKAELEIRNLHEKVDHLLRHQWQRLLEIQEIQTELMGELAGKVPRKRRG